MPTNPVTFDPLDAPLWKAFSFYQSLTDDVRAGLYQHKIWADPKNWQRNKPPAWIMKLKWKVFRYADVDTPTKLEKIVSRTAPGIYIFSVFPDVIISGFPMLALYVGISNENDSGRPLRERLKDYLPSRMSEIRKRKNIHKMLRLYYGHIWVYFCYVSKPSPMLRRAEQKLHGYLAPPAADRDYPVDMKPYKPAF
jgi:hypothetical protein